VKVGKVEKCRHHPRGLGYPRPSRIQGARLIHSLTPPPSPAPSGHGYEASESGSFVCVSEASLIREQVLTTSCVCVCVKEREREREREKAHHFVSRCRRSQARGCMRMPACTPASPRAADATPSHSHPQAEPISTLGAHAQERFLRQSIQKKPQARARCFVLISRLDPDANPLAIPKRSQTHLRHKQLEERAR
jgi:hypothetical protein